MKYGNFILPILGIVLYFFLSLLFWIISPFQSFFIDIPAYWVTQVIVCFIVFLFLWKQIKLEGKIKTILIFISIFLGLVTTIIYSETAHMHAMWEICDPAIKEKTRVHQDGAMSYEEEPRNKDGMVKSWYQHLECEDNILPIPWGKKAEFSDNPPGFEAVNK